MFISVKPPYEYHVGGSLPTNAPSYVSRQADLDLYDGLVKGEFCYVLNSRQMGKSSLRVQTMQQLQAAGIACAVIDITSIGTQQVSLDQWYASIIGSLASSFQIEFNLRTWWRENNLVTSVQRLNDFFEQILLPATGQNIAIFIDEIDSVLSLKFPIDDFFALIRSFYNKRAEKPEYKRLTFALLGVATPSDLIRDKTRTPFNIGRAINLTGLQFHEAQALLPGLADKGYAPEEILKEILIWTKGQPFLTQKLCQIIAQAQPANYQWQDSSAADWVRQLVRSQVITHWETIDEPEHFKTIRERLLRNEQRAGRLLGMYQQILLQGAIPSDDSFEQVELRLSGVVVEHEGEDNSPVLTVYNPIYASIFNQAWTEKALFDLRPYANALNEWLASDCQDESRLLRGQALQDAIAWSVHKSLSDRDYQFLAASQAVEKQQVEIMLGAEREANQVLAVAQQQATQTIQNANRKIKKGLIGLIGVSTLAFGVIGLASFLALQLESRRQEVVAGEISLVSNNSEVDFNNDLRCFSLIKAIKAGKQLQKATWLKNYSSLQAQVSTALYLALANLSESNSFERHINIVYEASFSPDGQILASASKDADVRLWKRDGTLLTLLKGYDLKYSAIHLLPLQFRNLFAESTGHQDTVYSVSFSPASNLIATASKDKTVKLWQTDGTLLKTFKGHPTKVIKVKFGVDGQTITSVGSDRSVRIWNLDGSLVSTFPAQDTQSQCVNAQLEPQNEDEIHRVDLSPNGKWLASTCQDKTVKVWELDGTLVNTFQGHTDEVYGVRFSPDGKMLASASWDHDVKLWQLDGTLIRTFKGHTKKLIGVNFSPDGQVIASTGYDNTIKLWNLNGNLITTFVGHKDRVHNVEFSPDGQTLVSGSSDNTVKLWERYNSLTTKLLGHTDMVQAVSFSPNGQLVASASSDRTIKLWNLKGEEIRTLQGHSASVISLSFSPDQQMLASSSHDKTVRLWQVENGKLLQTLIGHTDQVLGVSFSPNNQIIASGSNDKTVKLWRRDGTLLATLPHDSTVVRLGFSPNSKLLVSGGGEDRVKLWSMDTVKLIKNFARHESWLASVNFSPDGQTIASASNDKTVKLWNLNGDLLQTLKGHTSTVYYVAFSPDGKFIASASGDSTIKLWRRDGTLLITLKVQKDGISNLSFSPDSKTLASTSSEKTATLWNLADFQQDDVLEPLITRGCDRIRGYLKNNPTVDDSDRHICDS